MAFDIGFSGIVIDSAVAGKHCGNCIGRNQPCWHVCSHYLLKIAGSAVSARNGTWTMNYTTRYVGSETFPPTGGTIAHCVYSGMIGSEFGEWHSLGSIAKLRFFDLPVGDPPNTGWTIEMNMSTVQNTYNTWLNLTTAQDPGVSYSVMAVR